MELVRNIFMDNDTLRKIWLKDGGKLMSISQAEKDAIYYGVWDNYVKSDVRATVTACEAYEVNIKKPKKIIFHNPATIVFWKDGTKTVVKCQEGDTYDCEKGLLLCYVKKWVGNNKSRNLNDILKYAKYSEVENDI